MFDELERMLPRDNGLGSAAYCEACRLYHESNTDAWVQSLNRRRALAPSSQQVIHDVQSKAPVEAQPVMHEGASQRMWAFRWRRRWKARLGVVKTGEIDDLDTLRTKVSLGCQNLR